MLSGELCGEVEGGDVFLSLSILGLFLLASLSSSIGDCERGRDAGIDFNAGDGGWFCFVLPVASVWPVALFELIVKLEDGEWVISCANTCCGGLMYIGGWGGCAMRA